MCGHCPFRILPPPSPPSSLASPHPVRVQLAVVVVGFPATPLLLCRTRFCVSAGHTREDLDSALAKIEEVCDTVHLRYRRSMFGY